MGGGTKKNVKFSSKLEATCKTVGALPWATNIKQKGGSVSPMIAITLEANDQAYICGIGDEISNTVRGLVFHERVGRSGLQKQ